MAVQGIRHGTETAACQCDNIARCSSCTKVPVVREPFCHVCVVLRFHCGTDGHGLALVLHMAMVRPWQFGQRALVMSTAPDLNRVAVLQLRVCSRPVKLELREEEQDPRFGSSQLSHAAGCGVSTMVDPGTITELLPHTTLSTHYSRIAAFLATLQRLSPH